ncbi:MAG TPA: PadR family transcriptional regulator [Polyangiaceae bacterium]
MTRHEVSRRGRATREGRGHHHEDHHGSRRMRHGDVRVALLLALSEGPAHGYELGQRLLRASNGAWQPSPGSIYPTLQSLADEDLVSSDEQGQKRIYTLTPNGVTFLKERSARGEAPPWQDAQEGRSGELREAVVGLKLAARQIAAAGTSEQRDRAVAIILDARRRLYELLAKG